MKEGYIHKHSDHDHKHSDMSGDSFIEEGNAVICPVTGDSVDIVDAEKLGRYRDVDGKRFYFCCATCVQLFDEHPGKYSDKVHESQALVLSEKEHLADNIWAFRFTTRQRLSWTPGQFIRVEIPHPNPDSEGTKRWFTISSTPHDGFVQISTRITDTTFKQALAHLKTGESVALIEQPDGDFIWHESDKPLVFIAGGIGITPFYSMLKSRGHSGKPVSATLIYGGRTTDLPFRNEFDEATKRHKEFSVHYLINKELNSDVLVKLVPDIKSSKVYLSGPEVMVDNLAKELKDIGIQSDNLYQDFFPHYDRTNY